ncbi:acyl-CoA dehydrogenase family protein [Cryptosporangium sp. NPDC051539]|uniref:acyl-CoA dehydrogenase family protein n=1 Tax=Cryptosporangium sp. NPDC051539 TaxID=3363962 RepID=UPI0037B6A4F3
MTQSVDASRAEIRSWLEENFSPHLTVSTWLELLFEGCWAVPGWPAPWGGRGLTPAESVAVFEELRAAGVPGPPAGMGRALAGPTLIAFGTEEQKARYLRPILTGEEAWCQLFSEPGAGSDLAGLRTRAELRGDHYVLNGQKLWTSNATTADLGMLLARTDFEAPKHRGLTYFVIEMKQPGIEIRPLRKMSGDSTFSEVFLTDAVVPVENVVGGLNDGWRTALGTLMNERVAISGGVPLEYTLTAPAGASGREIRALTLREFTAAGVSYLPPTTGDSAMLGKGMDMLVRLAIDRRRADDPLVRQALATLHTAIAVSEWTAFRVSAHLEAGRPPGPEGSLGKMMASNVARLWRDTADLICGPDAVLSGVDGPLEGLVAEQFFNAPGPAIYGGSDQIQRNIVGERVLGLPRDPGIDSSVPFRELRTDATPRRVR